MQKPRRLSKSRAFLFARFRFLFRKKTFLRPPQIRRSRQRSASDTYNNNLNSVFYVNSVDNVISVYNVNNVHSVFYVNSVYNVNKN